MMLKILRFIILASLLTALIYFLNNSREIKGTHVPPLGKFIDPFNGYLQNAETENLSYEEIIADSSLQKQVTVVYDSNNIPHIFAENDDDLYFTQGYIIAQHRLWQLEFQTHAAAGRLSEIIGNNENIIAFDRLQRRLGMVEGAKASLEEYLKHPEMKQILNRYADGINAYIDQLNYKDLPIEYKLLDYKPEKWTILKTALVLEYMVNSLIGWDNDVANTNALKLLGKEKFNFLFPDNLPGIDPVVPTLRPWAFDSIRHINADNNYPYDFIYDTIPRSNPQNGSNNWAVSGKKTKSGYALLANDPHLGLNLPSLWFLMQLHSPNVSVTGYTFAGAPGIIIGYNNKISWGFTNSPRDQRDWYKIQLKDDSRKEYFYDSTWHPVAWKTEVIRIKNSSPFIDSVGYTHHGPMVYDHQFPGNGSNESLALKWIGHLPSRVLFSFYYLNRASNYQDYEKALKYWDAPSQNIVFASTNGDIALRVEGTFPLKWPQQGKFILDGTNPNHDWAGFIPHEHNAFMLNPERGFVSSANQHAVDTNYPYYTYSSTNEYYRNRRINRLLPEMSNITPKDFMKMHTDVYSIKAEEVLPLLLDSLGTLSLTGKHQEILNELKRWDYQYHPNIKAPAYFELWWKQFQGLLWDELKKQNLPLPKPNEFTTTYILRNHPGNEFIDRLETPEKETLTDLVTQSFTSIPGLVAGWEDRNKKAINWGNYNNVRLIHLARVIEPFNTQTLASGGSGDVINALKGSHGPSLRMIVEMSQPPKAWGVLPGGQSGNPGSPRYDNWVEKWVKGEYFELYLWDAKPADELSSYQQLFNPLPLP
ncbi:MAG: penicillin acylase family protein [Cyclobacteriaceae bacterium]|nr:penicillin acylase family protein [Cyclobacteriaceae bacterium]